MCIEVVAQLSPFAKAQVGAERLAKISGLSIRNERNDLGSCLHFSGTGACSCDLLAKGRPVDENPWTFDSGRAQGLATAISFLGKEAKSFLFRANWLGEELMEPQRIKLAALVNAIRTNRVERNVTYIVGNHG
jgi:hypothetical protein